LTFEVGSWSLDAKYRFELQSGHEWNVDPDVHTDRWTDWRINRRTMQC
jgi:hypothetical protein